MSGNDEPKWEAIAWIVTVLAVAAVLITNMILNHGAIDFSR